MAGPDIRASQAAVLLRCAEIDSNLQLTKQRLNCAAQQLRDLAHTLIPTDQASEQEAANAWFRERYGNRAKKSGGEVALRKHIAQLVEAIANAPKHEERTRRLRATSVEQHGGDDGCQGGTDLQEENP